MNITQRVWWDGGEGDGREMGGEWEGEMRTWGEDWEDWMAIK